MKKEEKKKVLTIVDIKAFLSRIYLNVYCEEEKDCTYLGKMSLNDIHASIPLEIEFTDETITFWWWNGLSMEGKQLGEKMRSYLLGFTTAFFKDAYVYVDDDAMTNGKMTLLLNF